MMDRWRSLFRCAGVNSGREAARSTSADKHQFNKKKSHWEKYTTVTCKCPFVEGETVTHNRDTTYYFEV